MRTLSLRTRLTVWYTLALLIVLSLFGANVLWQQRRIGMRRVDRELESLTTTLANVVQDELNEQDDPVTAATEATATVTAPGRAVAIADSQGGVLFARWSGLALPEPLPHGDAAPSARTVDTAAGAWRVHARPHAFGDRTLVLLSPARCRTSCASSAKSRRRCWSGSRSCCCWRAAAGCGWPRSGCVRSPT
jgi:hypothetical protein